MKIEYTRIVQKTVEMVVSRELNLPTTTLHLKTTDSCIYYKYMMCSNNQGPFMRIIEVVPKSGTTRSDTLSTRVDILASVFKYEYDSSKLRHEALFALYYLQKKDSVVEFEEIDEVEFLDALKRSRETIDKHINKQS